MKTKIIIMLTCFFLPALIMAQEKENQNKKDPDEQITVNKEYDEDGNLIRYDSTYTFEWHGDTMMVFPQEGGSFFSPDIFSGSNDIISKFFSDSLFHISPFGDEWNDEFFTGHEDFFNHFNQDFFDGYTWKVDSLNRFQWNDSTLAQPFIDNFHYPNLSEFFKNFEGLHNFDNGSFQNEDQQKEWDEIMKRYQKEMEEFNKKWDSKNKSEPKSDIKLQRL